MEKQDYSNHKRYYIPHHFLFYPVLMVLTCLGVYGIYRYHEHWVEWGAITMICILIGWLSLMLRQHYALLLQDRLIRLELRLRYYQLTQRRLEFIEYKLTIKQLAALRFSSDDQLPSLINEAIEQDLSSGEIKKRIRNWMPDMMRV
jgi:hypothetical protein